MWEILNEILKSVLASAAASAVGYGIGQLTGPSSQAGSYSTGEPQPAPRPAGPTGGQASRPSFASSGGFTGLPPNNANVSGNAPPPSGFAGLASQGPGGFTLPNQGNRGAI